jgi:Filamentous haemagglutinin family outer membrane protein
VTLGSDSTVDVSGAGFGFAGSLAILAGDTAQMAGTLKGGAAFSDLGGEFTLIANRLGSALPFTSGFTRSFEASLGQGNIDITADTTLTSEKVVLVANTGYVNVEGTIDASAASGGSIALYGAGNSTAPAGSSGASGVTIASTAKLYARYQAPDPNSPGYGNGSATLVQRGGTITLGTTGTPDADHGLNNQYGYENVSASGAITVQAGAIFDVSGGTGGANIDNTGGSVIVRAPILTSNSINVSFNGTVVTNAKADGTASGDPLVVNAFAVWSTTDNIVDPNKHFDGIIDPAGFFDGSGTRVISADANGLYPTSTADAPADGAYLPHVAFYQTTLLDFVNNPFDSSAVAGDFLNGAMLKVGGNAPVAMPPASLHLRPEIDLVNPTPATGSTSVNGGNITVASNWNFGALTIDGNGNFNLLYRTTDGAEPGTLVMRAANNVQINATISDGFFVSYDAGGSAAAIYLNESNSPLYLAYLAMFSPDGTNLIYDASALNNLLPTLGQPDLAGWGVTNFASVAATPAFFGNMPQSVFDSLQFHLQPPATLTCAGGACSNDVNNQYDRFYAQYASMFRAYEGEIVSLNSGGGGAKPFNSTVTQGGQLLSYSNFDILISGLGLADPSSIAIPGAPTSSSQYYDLVNGLGTITFDGSGAASTTRQDYVTQWVTYFFDVANYNIFATQFSPMTSYVSNPTLANVSGLAASIGMLGAIAVTPPYAPPAYTSVPSDYVAVSTANPAPPTVQIANNPAIYSLGNAAYYNTTSSANLMPAALSGKGSFSYNIVGGAFFNGDGTSSVNPDAVVQLATLSPSVTGNVSIDGHTSYINPFTDPSIPSGGSSRVNVTIDVPTMVRTGTGSITIAAAGDFALLDQVAPGAVYTAGHVTDNSAGFTVPTLPSTTVSNGLISTPAWATGGGNIAVTAGRDIIGIETPVDPTGSQFSTGSTSAGVSTGQFWSAWYYVDGHSTGNAVAPFDPSAGGVQFSSWVNYGSFFQQFGALGGGNITLQAGRNVKDVSASLPETIQVSGGQSAGGPAAIANYFGGGDLLVQAGNDVLSGVYYVGRGTGLIRAGADVVSDATLHQTLYQGDAPTISGAPTFAVPLLLAVQDSTISVQAAGSIVLGGIFEPTSIRADLISNVLPSTFNAGQAARTLPIAIGAAFDSFGANSGVTLLSSTGSITVNTLVQADNGSGNTDTLFKHTTQGWGFIAGGVPNNIIAPNLSVTALTGDIQFGTGIQLFPSATGELSLIAGGSIGGANVTMLDGNNVVSMLGSPIAALVAPLHAGDDIPVLIYAGEDINGGSFNLLKSARLWAGRDVANVSLVGMNVAEHDITSVVAGRDILARRPVDVVGAGVPAIFTLLTLYGPGDFVVSAGRNLGPLSAVDAATIARNPTLFEGGGIFAIGNGANSSLRNIVVKPYLPQQGANIDLIYGIGGGIDYAAAIARYGDPATAAASGIDFVSGIIPQLDQILQQLIVKQATAAGIANPNVTIALTPAEAGEIFPLLGTLSINGKLADLAAKAGLKNLTFNLTSAQFVSLLHHQDAMQLIIDQGFLAVLKQVGLDYNDPTSRYAGQYARAYEAISTLFPASLGYTDNSAGGSGVVPPLEHTGDLRMARSLVETQTGGDVDILGPGGSAFVGSNSADTLTPAQQGILSLQGGSIRSYTDGSVLVYQSRVFTEQGGNIEMFSANGDLNAGKGPKSSAAYPPLRLICDVDGYCRVNPAGLVTGAGVGALLSVPGQNPDASNVILTAPHGIIDAGAAGIRVAGNLNLVALQVLNAFNIQANGTVTGLAVPQGAPVNALTSANNTAGAAAKTADVPAQSNKDQPSVIIVEVLGYGGGGEPDQPSREEKRERGQGRQGYNPDSAFQIIGLGEAKP